ncbi:MAG: 50S ribosomal protein L23 [Dehalococcoidia bacterium]
MPKALHPYQVIRRPIITEKSTLISGLNQYIFEVAREANKPQIREAVEMAFNVQVVNVRTMNVKGALRRLGRSRRLVRAPSWKKAIVTLQEGNKIELFEGP